MDSNTLARVIGILSRHDWMESRDLRARLNEGVPRWKFWRYWSGPAFYAAMEELVGTVYGAPRLYWTIASSWRTKYVYGSAVRVRCFSWTRAPNKAEDALPARSPVI
jgi:hypothetical protein